MRKLSRIILINAAGFDYLEFPVGGHSQVIGVNGHGKSTVLRTVLFFYLGSNDKAPYALHETKADFVSHYLGEPPSYLIYEVERGEGKPAYHVAVTRPAGRIQFHFVDAPYRRDYYLEGSFVQPVNSVLERIREDGVAVDSVGSYDQFVQRIYGVVPSAYAVFKPVARSSGQIGVLARIISGIFTVSQLDADKLKTALTCGMRSDVSSGELDLALLKGQLENFRRVNRAVKAYLSHEQEALELVDLAESYDTVKVMRSDAIRELIQAAKRLSGKAEEIAASQSALHAEQELEKQRHEAENVDLQRTIGELTEAIAILRDKVQHGVRIEREYLEHDIDGKLAKRRQLPALEEKRTLADEQHRLLTAQYQDENQRRETLLAKVRETRTSRFVQFEKHRAESERLFREGASALDREREEALEFLNLQLRNERSSLEPRRKGNLEVRNRLNEEFSQFGEGGGEPPELAQARHDFARMERSLSSAKEQIAQLKGQVSLIRAKGEKEQQAIAHTAKEERDTLQRQIEALTASRAQYEAELEKFNDSLARFYQTEAPASWPQAARALNRETLFRNAKELNAQKASSEEGAWGVTFSTDALAEPGSGYDREALVKLSEEAGQALADANESLQATQERYLTQSGELEKRIANEQGDLQSEIDRLTERWRKNTDEVVKLENRLHTLDSQWKEERQQRREALEKKSTRLREEEEAIRAEELQIEERFNLQKSTLGEELGRKKAGLESEAATRLATIAEEEAQARKEWEKQDAEIEESFQTALAEKGVDRDLIEAARRQSAAATREINEIEAFREEVDNYVVKKREVIDLLPGWQSELRLRTDALESRKADQKRSQERHAAALSGIRQQLNAISKEASELQKDRDAEERFRSDSRFAQEHGYFDRSDLPPAAFYRPGAVVGFLREAESAHQQREDIAKKGDRDAQSFLNRFDAETLDRRVLGFSPRFAHFDWFIFVNSELKPFVEGRGIDKMRQIQTQEFAQLIRNICGKNAAFREGIRQVNQTASLVQKNLEANNFVDVLDSVELKVERVDNKLTQVLAELEEFADLTFSGDRDLFGKRADRDQSDKAIAAFERLLKEIDSHRGSVLRLTDCFDFLIRVHENGHDMGWRKSLDHIGSTGTDYLVKMLIYLSLIEVFRERTIDSRDGHAAVHCVMDETGVLAAKYIRSVLDYAKERHIILITAGHSQQTVGFENWMLVRKRGKRFGGQAVLRKVLRCD